MSNRVIPDGSNVGIINRYVCNGRVTTNINENGILNALIDHDVLL